MPVSRGWQVTLYGIKLREKRKRKRGEKKKDGGGEQAAAPSVTTGELKTHTLVDQKRQPNDPARPHFYNAETLSILGYDKTGNLIQLPVFQENKIISETEEQEAKEKERKKKKKS